MNIVPSNSLIERAVTQPRIMSPVGRGMSEDASPSPTTPPKLKKTPGSSTLEAAAAASSRTKMLRNNSTKITDYFSHTVELSGMNNISHAATNGDIAVFGRQHELQQHPTRDILNGDMKPMILDKVLVSGIRDKFDEEDAESDIIYATQEELDDDSSSRDSSSFGNYNMSRNTLDDEIYQIGKMIIEFYNTCNLLL